MPSSSDASQFTSLKRYSAALVQPRRDNKQVTHLHQPLAPSVGAVAGGEDKWLAPLTRKNISVVNNVRPPILSARKNTNVNQFFSATHRIVF